MNSIAHKAIVLKLNSKWKAIHVELVSKSICDLMSGVVKALDIRYAINPDGTPDFDTQEYLEACDWDKWVTLPVRPWDLVIHSAKLTVRVPTVVITANYNKIHEKKFHGKPTKETLYMRDDGVDGYTGKEIPYEEATIDHIVPKARGGENTYENTVLTDKRTNNMKGHRLNSEVGLKLYVNPHTPKPVAVCKMIRTIRHHDWKTFIKDIRKA